MIKWVCVYAIEGGACYSYECTLCNEKISVSSENVSDYQSSLLVQHLNRTHFCCDPTTNEQDCAEFSSDRQSEK